MAELIKLFGMLFRFTRGNPRLVRLQVLALVGTSIVAGLANTGLLALINARIGRLTEPAGRLVWIFAALCVLLPLTRFASQAFLVHMSQNITYDLRMTLSRRILAAPLRTLEELGAARLLATVTEDIGTIINALTNVPLVCLQTTVVVSCLIYLGWLHWGLLLVVVAFVTVGVISYRTPLRRSLRHFHLGRERWDEVFESLRGLTSGVKELKMHGARRADFFARKLEPAAVDLRRHFIAGATISAVANSWGQVLFFVIIGLLLFVLPGSVSLSPKVLVGYTLTILYMLTPLDVMLNVLPTLGRAVISARKIEQLGLSLDGAASEPVEAGGVPALGGWRSVELAAVTHTFYREDSDDNFTLGPIDLHIKPGELVFLIGGNGSGKTTLAKLLLGLYRPESGELRLDGRTVTDADRDAYRQLFSVVFSDFFLFDLLLGLPDPHLDDSARGYLRKLHLERKVRVEQGALSTLDLSQGQRKRLALLTAYLEDRPIYLFDEWAADQDPQFKEIFYLQLLPELKARGKTVVVISHDDQYYGTADRLVKINYGQLEYSGGVGEYLAALAAQRPPADALAPAES